MPKPTTFMWVTPNLFSVPNDPSSTMRTYAKTSIHRFLLVHNSQWLAYDQASSWRVTSDADDFLWPISRPSSSRPVRPWCNILWSRPEGDCKPFSNSSPQNGWLNILHPEFLGLMLLGFCQFGYLDGDKVCYVILDITRMRLLINFHPDPVLSSVAKTTFELFLALKSTNESGLQQWGQRGGIGDKMLYWFLLFCSSQAVIMPSLNLMYV